MSFLSPESLEGYYSSGLSMFDIAKQQKVSVHKVVYWMNQYNIPRRSRSEATYIKKHPNGDPFVYLPPNTIEKAKLFGLGLGL